MTWPLHWTSQYCVRDGKGSWYPCNPKELQAFDRCWRQGRHCSYMLHEFKVSVYFQFECLTYIPNNPLLLCQGLCDILYSLIFVQKMVSIKLWCIYIQNCCIFLLFFLFINMHWASLSPLLGLKSIVDQITACHIHTYIRIQYINLDCIYMRPNIHYSCKSDLFSLI